MVFDVSHLGSLRVTGHGAKATLQWAFTNDLDRIEPGRAQYTHLLDETDAHVVDDIIVATGPDGSIVDETIDVFDADGTLLLEDEKVSVYDADANLVAQEETVAIALDKE